MTWSLSTNPAERVSAICLDVRARGHGVEHSVGLLEAVSARGALDPAEVTSGVSNCCEVPCRCAQGELHQVLATAGRHCAAQVHYLRLYVCELEGLLQLVDTALATFHGVQESLAGRFPCCVGSSLETVPLYKLGAPASDYHECGVLGDTD